MMASQSHVVRTPSLEFREDYSYFNDESLKILSRGYIAEGTPREKWKEAAITRVNFLIDRAEEILGRKLPVMRLGIRRGWISPSSPVWSNFGTDRGLPISCNGSRMADSVDSIAYKVAEISMMTKEGAGTSLYMGDLRASGEPISGGGKSEGPVHFARLVQEAVTVISQGNTRRGNAAVYLDVDHPDIDEWMMMRSITDGVHHPIQHLSFGVVISDAWMNAMLGEAKGGPKRKLLTKIVNKRRETGYHKQVANRLVEPFMWMDLLVTATHWANFLHLRDHPDAEPHIRDLAVLVGKALEAAKLRDLDVGEWHLPYIKKADRKEAQTRFKLKENRTGFLKKISAARCARISYKPFDGDSSYERELERFEMLVGNDAVHASPLEHQCSPDQVATVETTWWNDEDNAMLRDSSLLGFLHPDLHGPLTGFIQFRKTVPNEAVHD